MKEVEIIRGTRVCDKKHLNGCGRTIRQGEKAFVQKRSAVRGRRRTKYLCKECYDKRSY
jgi:hypothetical protein